MKRLILTLLVLSFIWQAAYARPLYFGEFWNNIAYYSTNVERKNFDSFLGRFEGKLGVNLFDSPFQAYGVYYCAASQSTDYWDNSLFYGAGLRFKPFEQYHGTSWANEWITDFKIFVESLSSTYLKDAASAEAAGLATTDVRAGFDLWHEWNLDAPIPSVPWGELWANLSYRQTNFGWEDFNNYVFYFQPKIGRHLGSGIGVYLCGDLTYSGKSGPSYSFLNVADYGVGIRFEPFRANGDENDLMRKFKMYAEFLGVTYLKDQPIDPNKKVSSDIRFGIDFSNGR